MIRCLIKKTCYLGLLIAGLSSFGSSVVLAAEDVNCPPFPEPKAKVEVVAPFIVFNGVPMRIKRFDSEKNKSEILAFYRQAWAHPKPEHAPLEYDTGPWQVISVLRGTCFFTVQVQGSGKGSTGLLSASKVSEQPRVIASEQTLPMMFGSKVINDIDHFDQGKSARTLLLTNSFSTDANADFYRKNMSDRGWTLISGHRLDSKTGPKVALVMKKGLAEASLTISTKAGTTAVLANLMQNP